MQVEELDGVMELELDDLAEALKETKESIKGLEEAIWLIEKRIVEVMEERGATVADTEGYMVKMTIPVSYDYSILARLREITDPKLLEECYDPAWEKVVTFGEKWNMTKAKALANLSHEHRAIIEDAKIPGTQRIKFEAKPEMRGR